MAETAPRVFLYALLAGLSPLALLATLAALGSGRGRVNGTVFAFAFLVAQSIVLVIAFFLGSAAAPDEDDSQRTFVATLELALGSLLLIFALRGLAGRPPTQPERSRTEAVLLRLRGLRPATAFSIGALLGVGGIKRLTITLVTGATIAIGALERSEEAALALMYIVIATLVVWLPVALYLIAGKHADRATARSESWLVRNEQQVTSATMLVFGAGLCADALVRLL
jgi:Sap, sulfolipid-1-addressing protein